MPQNWLVTDSLKDDAHVIAEAPTMLQALAEANAKNEDFMGDPIEWTHISAGTSDELLVGVYKAHAAWRAEVFIRRAPAPTSALTANEMIASIAPLKAA
jgi:hypothetical protein